MRVLITGQSGFVGRHFQARLQKRFPTAEVLPNIGDITNAEAVDQAVQQHRPDICLHLAAVSAIGTARRDPAHAWRVNVHGALHVGNALLRHASECLFIFASTSEVYGKSFVSGAPLDEGSVLAPMNTYAATKAAADLALGALVPDGLRVVRMRPFNHTGPGQTPNFVVSSFAEQVVRISRGVQSPVIKVGNLNAVRDFLDVRDVCDAYLDAVAMNGNIESGSIFNLCSGKSRSIKSILEDLISIEGIKTEIVVDPERFRAVDIAAANGSADAARQVLKWEPVIPWSQTLRDILTDWHRRFDQNPELSRKQ